ncbi:hypothetical protein [Flexithrix dorotheae]|uniref:hypothetical protein n=1 Tax=Flexithrix dorotheae TaxID=70993 RepID=UPI0003679CFB|nr:hypothetical protein [Flexithrix dorotheae]
MCEGVILTKQDSRILSEAFLNRILEEKMMESILWTKKGELILKLEDLELMFDGLFLTRKITLKIPGFLLEEGKFSSDHLETFSAGVIDTVDRLFEEEKAIEVKNRLMVFIQYWQIKLA